ncbi:DUF2357 domain-containing protein [Treponema primitia]|uniref:DUF2357 domain-containing protein n=1 Tax=Treponema primitia TaxID=88058 RepID=UPI003981757F
MTEAIQNDFIDQLVSRGVNQGFSKAYSEFGCEYEQLGSKKPLDGIHDKQLRMYAVDQSTAIKDIRETLAKIRESVPVLKRICARPKSHLKSINEVRPIDTVKRVGYESISYLASHSEDWLARTASGLKPARLFSRVEEDDFAIYENKVVKTLIDRVYRFLKENIDDLEYKHSQIKGILNSRDTNLQGFGFDRSFQIAISELIPDNFFGDPQKQIEVDLAQEMITDANQLKNIFSELKKSQLYRLLHRIKSVSNPIDETNIFLFDKDYKKGFSLWKEMQKSVVPEQEVEIKPDISKSKEAYLKFCKTLIHYSLNSLKFKQIDKDNFDRTNLSVSVFYASGKFNIKFRDITKRELVITNTLQIPIEDGENYERFSRLDDRLIWDNDITETEIEAFCKKLVIAKNNKNFQEKGQRRLSLQLKSSILEVNKKAGTPIIKNIIIIPLYCQIEDEERLKMLSVLEKKSNESADLTIFALPLIQNNEQFLINYASRAGDRFGVLPLTLFDINSYRRLQKIFLKTILEFNDEKCPYCGGIMRQTENGSICNDCDMIVTTTICSYEECHHRYKYIWYSVNHEKIRAMRSINGVDFFNQDSLFQYKDIVKMDISDKLMPVCPKCGNK